MADNTTGGMIALIPTAEDAARLRLPGGEPAAELHLTLMYLGPDGSVFTPENRDDMETVARYLALQLPPLTANIFGVAHWNGNGEQPSWVWNVGDDRESDGPGLDYYRSTADEILYQVGGPDVPDQHRPWVAHVCAAYTDDLTLVRRLEQRLGPVTFDRLRLSFGDDDRDIQLTGDGWPTAIAASGLNREPLPHEEGFDFAEHNAQWERAVESAAGRLHNEMAHWRMQIRDQLSRSLDAPEELSDVSVETRDAAEIIYEAMEKLALQAGKALQRQAERQGVTVGDWSLPEDASEESLTAALGGGTLLRAVSKVTADALASNMVQKAKRLALGLLGRAPDSVSLANEVDRQLHSGQADATRAPVGLAMSAAQTTGRHAVLQAAPRAQYVASEILDRNTCGPCRAVDGEVFSSLETAMKAYPVMGYDECSGTRWGNACRGFIMADWSGSNGGSGEGVTAAAATMRADDPPKEASVTTEALKKGKPSKGTAKDKRLKENDYAAAADFAWLPEHHSADGAVNPDALADAVNALADSGRGPGLLARAKAHLRADYAAAGVPVPSCLEATGLERVAFGVEEGYEAVSFVNCPPGFVPDDDGDCQPTQKKGQAAAAAKCPPGFEPDDDGDCQPVKTGGPQQTAGQTLSTETPEVADENAAPWRGPLTVEGIETGDGREFDSGALTWADLPLPLRWNRVDSHGGEARTEAVNVGRIDNIWREDSGLIMGEGVLDLSDDDGRKVHGKVKNGMLRGVSVDVDSIKDADMELVWAEADPDGEGEADPFAQLFAAPEKVVFHKGRIRAATLVDIPAFAEAYIALLDEAGAVVAGGQPIGALREARPVRSHSVEFSIPARPPKEWFTNPDLSVPTGITVTPEGRVYGHAALWGTCHIGQAGMCVTPPQEDDHPYFMTGHVWCEDDSMTAVGQITLGTGHADLSLGHRAAAEHYDNTGVAVADVSVGNDAHGIWVAGSVRPGTSPERIHELRASGQVSGDWRNIGGKLRLVGLLAVNVPGFPVPELRTRYTLGQQLALVAAGRPQLTEALTEDDLDQMAFARIMRKLGQRVHRED